ncbi:MAG: hypothetical protein HY368_01440, partial [Candidatus Aenigmarchaeota archaeon]|nr:hypothetical protein [Candidatus Aenigmarchaeota archaeon]
TNVLLIIGYENLNAYRASLDSFLERGGTIFMLSHLYENQVNDGYMNTVFGLKWTGDGSGPGRFYDTTTPSKVSYKVANYYSALRKEDASAAAFSGFSGGGVNQVAVDDRSVVVSSPANVISYVKINQFIVNNRGRTVWFSDYDYGSNSPDAQQLKNLTKAALMWASGERYKMDPFRKSAGPVFSEAKLLSTSGSEHFEVSLLFWKIFF